MSQNQNNDTFPLKGGYYNQQGIVDIPDCEDTEEYDEEFGYI